VLGFDDEHSYETNLFYYGCTVGRVANRIANGRFELEGDGGKHQYQLACNNGPNALHGGPAGFSGRSWSLLSATQKQATFQLSSAAGEEGYPGQLTVTVTFLLVGRALRIEYHAQTNNVATIVNLTNHSYFNLSGLKQPTVLEHTLRCVSTEYLELNCVQIPTGQIVDGRGSCMDFCSQSHRLGERIRELDRGYDHCYLARPAEEAAAATTSGCELVEAARLWCPESGIRMIFRTTTPGFQLYTANWVKEQRPCKPSTHGDAVYGQWSGVCLEAQAFPDAVNRPEWLNQVLLRNSGQYHQITEYEFDVSDSL
jgi:aldose 1-epimerase